MFGKMGGQPKKEADPPKKKRICLPNVFTVLPKTLFLLWGGGVTILFFGGWGVVAPTKK